MIGTSHPPHTHTRSASSYIYKVFDILYMCWAVIKPLTLIALTLALTQTQSVMSLISMVLYHYDL